MLLPCATLATGSSCLFCSLRKMHDSLCHTLAVPRAKVGLGLLARKVLVSSLSSVFRIDRRSIPMDFISHLIDVTWCTYISNFINQMKACVQVVPHILEPSAKLAQAAGTTIVLPLNDEMQQDHENLRYKIASIRPTLLLFLHRLTKLSIVDVDENGDKNTVNMERVHLEEHVVRCLHYQGTCYYCSLFCTFAVILLLLH